MDRQPRRLRQHHPARDRSRSAMAQHVAHQISRRQGNRHGQSNPCPRRRYRDSGGAPQSEAPRARCPQPAQRFFRGGRYHPSGPHLKRTGDATATLAADGSQVLKWKTGNPCGRDTYIRRGGGVAWPPWGRGGRVAVPAVSLDARPAENRGGTAENALRGNEESERNRCAATISAMECPGGVPSMVAERPKGQHC